MRYLNTERQRTNLIGTNMAAATYKPLFNRRYLFWLMWAVALVIVLLHATGRETPHTPAEISWQPQPPHWHLFIANVEQHQLQASLNLPPGWNLKGQQLRAALQVGIEDWLLQPDIEQQLTDYGWQAQLLMDSTGLRLQLALPHPPAHTQLDWLSQALPQLSDSLTPQQQQRLMAEWRLDQQQPEPRLLAEFASWLFPTPPELPAWTLIYQSDTVLPIPATSAILPDLHTSPLSHSHQREERGYVNQPYQLLGWSVPLATSTDSLVTRRAAVIALQQILDGLPDTHEYRLIWNPLPPQSYLALIVSGAADQELERQLRELILDPASDRLFQEAKTRLQAQDPQVREWLELTARLQLATGNETDYTAAFQQLTTDAIRQQLLILMNPAHQLNLMLKPY
ncbi:MAG: hypothetical protein ACK4L8_16260 [Nitrincola lacisaponensis]|uniref:hypothetical protein n=1 Tax=Nitrincola lacisaponensis TaxID=267850 RepID=UPI003919EB0E